MDPTTDGYSFWRNYWCDLLSSEALDGGDHSVGAWWARVGFACFSIALLHFWPRTIVFLPQAPRARLAARAGSLSAWMLFGVAAIPSAASQAAHGVLVTLATSTGIVATGLLVSAQRPARDVLAFGLGVGALTLACIALLQYVRQGLLLGDYATWLPGLQKLTTVLVLLWIARTEWRMHVSRQPAPSPAGPPD